MNSQILTNSQSTAVVCLPESAKNVRNLRLRDMAEPYEAPDTRVLSFARCLWCDQHLRAKRTKPPKFCGDACRKAFERSQDLNTFARRIERQLLKAHKKDLRELNKTDRGLRCRTPRSRSEFESAVGVPCTFPTEQVDSNLGILTPVPEPCPVLPEFRTFTPETPLFIGPLLKNGRKRGRA
jgi:hypothetical protein